MEENKQRKIDEINELVAGYKEGHVQNAQTLLEIFRPFLLKQCNKYNQLYPGVHNWSNVEQEAMIIFRDLLDEYTVGGRAYFNVFVMRKLPFRLRYFFIKEIKHRGKNLCHEEDQMLMHNLISEDNEIEDFINDIEDKENVRIIVELIESDLLNDRERDMVKQNIIGMKSHEKIAQGYGISRSRVSKIIGNSIKKIKKEYEDYIAFRSE